MENKEKVNKINQFIQGKLTELSNLYEQTEDSITKLQYAAKIVSYAEVTAFVFVDY